MQIGSRKLEKILKILFAIYGMGAVVQIFTSNVYFESTSPFIYIFGAFLVCFSIAAYYLQLLTTNRILNFRKELALFISFGLIVYNLGITPLFIFQRYIGGSEEFRAIYAMTLDLANFFLYTVFAIGFLQKSIAIRKEKKEDLSIWNKKVLSRQANHSKDPTQNYNSSLKALFCPKTL